MILKTEQLERHLGGQLLPVYLISGDEPLLVQETCDQIRNSARDKGFIDREILHGDKGDANVLSAASESLSLFAEQKIYEFRFQKIPTKEFQEAFAHWCENPPDDQILLISCPKLDKAISKKIWYKKLEKMGAHITVWPVDAKNLSTWLANRARKSGLNLESDALRVLAERVEGNLFAAKQEIDRLALLYTDSGTISASMMREYVGDNSRFDSFELLEASFAGNTRRLTRILTGLKLEGEAIAKINGLLTYELRNLSKMAWDCSQGETPAQVVQKYRVWGNKKAGYIKSLQRFPATIWQRILSRCLELDKMIKGQAVGDPWTALESLLLQISGQGLWKTKQ